LKLKREKMNESSSYTIGVTGSSGFIGSNLVEYLLKSGFSVKLLKRDFNNQDLALCDVIINLSGANISKRWSKSYKKVLESSRVDTTAKIVSAIKDSPNIKLLINTSATGIYKQDSTIIQDESSNLFEDDFLSLLCKKWEEEALKAAPYTRVVIMRLGVVMSKNGGALPKLSLPVKFGVAAITGEGDQYISWIMLEDLLRAINHIINNQSISGVVNFTTPYPLTNRELTLRIASEYRVFFKMRIPETVLKLVMGEASSVLIKGVRAYPGVLEKSGFTFVYPHFPKKNR
jgi:uncharacterized protein (TIGR01777 family)